MAQHSRILTFNPNVIIAAPKEDESHSNQCAQILGNVPDRFILAELATTDTNSPNCAQENLFPS
jgi:hypothetical protein